MGVEFCQKLFLHLLRWSPGFCLFFCWCGVSHWLICMCWTILMTLGWNPLGRGIWTFLCVVGFSLPIFFENFCIYILQRYWPVIFFFSSVFIWFWYQGDGGFKEWLWECSLLFSLLEEFEKDKYNFFVCSVEFLSEAWTFVCRELVCFFFLWFFLHFLFHL